MYVCIYMAYIYKINREIFFHQCPVWRENVICFSIILLKHHCHCSFLSYRNIRGLNNYINTNTLQTIIISVTLGSVLLGGHSSR